MEGVTEAAFLGNNLIQDGVIRQLEIVGEAVRHISAEIRNQYPAVAWKEIAGMRDKLIHDYFGVDLEIVWQTAKGDLPPLKQQIQTILTKLEAL